MRVLIFYKIKISVQSHSDIYTKKISSCLLLKVTNTMNKSLKTKTFLDIPANIQITPWHKKDNKGNKENNRPFSTLPNFSKLS